MIAEAIVIMFSFFTLVALAGLGVFTLIERAVTAWRMSDEWNGSRFRARRDAWIRRRRVRL